MKSRLVSDHLLLNICRNSEDFAKYRRCKERCREYSRLPVRSSVCYTLRIFHRIHLHFELSEGSRALVAHLLNCWTLRSEPSGKRRHVSSGTNIIENCGHVVFFWFFLRAHLIQMVQWPRDKVTAWKNSEVEQATTHPAAEPHFNGSIMSSRGAWQYHSSTSQMISLDCLQEIVFHIVFNHQTAEQMNIIENELTGGFFPPSSSRQPESGGRLKKVENGIENAHSDMQF